MWQRTLKVSGLLGLSLCYLACSPGRRESTAPQDFGKTKEGKEIKMNTISNSKGMSAEIINYGAIVARLKTADRNGKIEDIILGYDDLAGYEKDNTFQGAIVGRYGNRIAQGKFVLDDTAYQ
jgi:aldose 1-epimerase